MSRRATVDEQARFVSEYDSAAEWCAVRGLRGAVGDPLPENLSARVLDDISTYPELFEERVRECAYARAMRRHNILEE